MGIFKCKNIKLWFHSEFRASNSSRVEVTSCFVYRRNCRYILLLWRELADSLNAKLPNMLFIINL